MKKHGIDHWFPKIGAKNIIEEVNLQIPFSFTIDDEGILYQNLISQGNQPSFHCSIPFTYSDDNGTWKVTKIDPDPSFRFVSNFDMLYRGM